MFYNKQPIPMTVQHSYRNKNFNIANSIEFRKYKFCQHSENAHFVILDLGLVSNERSSNSIMYNIFLAVIVFSVKGQ